MQDISSNGFITLNRGDTFSAPLFINQGDPLNPLRFDINLHPEANIYFGVMEPNQSFENALIRKKYNKASLQTGAKDVVITLTPGETEYLHPGKYYYEVKLELNPRRVYTVIPKTEFFIV